MPDWRRLDYPSVTGWQSPNKIAQMVPDEVEGIWRLRYDALFRDFRKSAQ